MFEGQSLRLRWLPGDEQQGLAELCFDRQDEAINKLDERMVNEFRQATDQLTAEAAAGRLRGVLVSSAKEVFIVGADITEFGAMFDQPVADIATDVYSKNQIFNAFEDLPVASVVALNGFALGGGLEMALTAALRVASTAAQVGLPEVKLGLFPGFGGTVRLSRVAGPQTALTWVAGGASSSAEAARKAGVVDAVATPDTLRDVALDLLRRAASGEIDWQALQQRKRVAVPMSTCDVQELFGAARQQIGVEQPRQRPAALMALSMMEQAALCPRDIALQLEAQAFAEVTQTQAARGLVQVFLNEQAIKKQARHYKAAQPPREVAVLGAGIMGGGIAYAAALRGAFVRLKDIAPAALEAGTTESAKLLSRQVLNGRITQEKADAVRAAIHAQTDETGFAEVDLVIEAIVERLDVKRRVLAALEPALRADTIIASNTSSLRIADIAAPLARPQNFVGMHFFNPVPVMPLVEVVRGPQTSDVAVAVAVGQVLAMGKTPIVVKDCTGFLVNRLVTPYLRGFTRLLSEGADFVAIDQTMEDFGWPMGPAYLQDVVGMDVGLHVGEVISAAYADRMPSIAGDAIAAMVAAGRYGQKNGRGFYAYTPDSAGKPRKAPDPEAQALVAHLQPNGPQDFKPEHIVERLMLPLIMEAVRALEESVVATPAELDMALLLGLGFPAHAGGALKYADWLGLPHVVARGDALAALDPACLPPARLREMAAAGQRFYG